MSESNEKLAAVRQVSPGQVHVSITHWINEEDPSGPLLFRLELYPVPHELGARIMQECAELAMQMLDEAGLVEGQAHWQRTVDNSPASEVDGQEVPLNPLIVPGPETAQ